MDFGSNTIRIDFLQQPATYGMGSYFTFSSLDPQLAGCPPAFISGITVTTNKPAAQFNVVGAATFGPHTVTIQIAPNSKNLDWQPGEFVLVKLNFACETQLAPVINEKTPIVPSSAQTDQREPNTPNTKPFLGQRPPAPPYVPGPAGPDAPPSVAPNPKDPPASKAPAPNGNVPSKITSAATPFSATGEKAPGPKSVGGQSSPASTTAFGPALWYWENGSYQNHNESTCTINLAPNITFYIQYFYCAWDHCGGGFGANPYRWSFWLYRNGQVYWSQSGVQTSQVWINYPITLPTPLPPGTYHGELKYEKRVFISSWQTQFDITTNSIQIIEPSQPYWQAPAPQLRVEVVANAGNDMLYQLRGWQVNGNATLQPQWNLYNSNIAGTEIGPPISVNWSAMGVHYTIPSNLNLNQWYMLKYGNYSACYSWNETRRLIYVNK